MGTFLSNIQVFSGALNSSKLMNELVLAIRDSLDGGLYEETDDAESADRSLILHVSSDRWISLYDQKLDEQHLDEMDALGKAISRVGVSAVGSVLHDSDLLVMRLYQNGRMADTIINDLDLFNEMSEGSRPRKRNGQPSKWSEVCAPGVSPADLKAIWEKETIFADDALALAAELLAIPDHAILRGYEVDQEFQQDKVMESNVKVLHYRSTIRFSDYVTQHNGPKLAFTSWNAYAAADVGSPAAIVFGLRNEGQAFTGLDVLLWGPALDELHIELGLGKLFRTLPHFHVREEWASDPESLELEAEGELINGYRYRFSEINFPEGGLQGLYAEDAAKLGLMKEWMEQMYQPQQSFQLTLTGRSVNKSNLYIGFVPSETPEGQIGLGIPVFIGLEPDRN
ncbi:hypothetical protein [Paenibacillus montanisoli]|uniref:Uncharacterized protein n=1 Tax=Paenibacillus montanisoli TaxID=2081970 RepID=A0A328U2S9_9BACL|nr:hypothetical protein [Paenibacillus montanisoli]RAP75701.1 hypothetical protein DL346_09600 [Paenibacillus montanisoli]